MDVYVETPFTNPITNIARGKFLENLRYSFLLYNVTYKKYFKIQEICCGNLRNIIM